ncbi:MmcB family DNA repair protein [Agromyces humi]|uniref:MmcB family DNA repair protein n=1 Tax=Agromyces humi TaxID=1766800 RepID=UPI00135AB376|nr:MmcB family DNA repair protein [Agromyces humi]
MPSQLITAKQVLTAVRRKHHKDAVVREVVVDDPFHQAILNRWRLTGPSARFWDGKIDPAEVAPSIPEGWNPSDSVPQRRIDALIVTSRQLTAVEIKVTRSDFKRDSDEKRRAWRLYSHRFVYAVPRGLISPLEVPHGCGLWEFDVDQFDGRSPKRHGITTTKKAVVNPRPAPIPDQVFISLAHRVSKYETREERVSANG